MLQTKNLPAELHHVFMDVFEKQIQHENKPGNTLFHYTSLTSLMGMVESRKIWMSKADFLNDSSELIYFAGILKKSIAKLKAETGEEPWQRYIGKFEDCMGSFLNRIHEDGLEVYVFSLSHNKDSLALWYNYAQGDGYNIGFKTRDLLKKEEGLINSINMIHGYVLYQEESQEEFLSESLHSAFPLSKGREDEKAVREYFDLVLTACATFFKNPAFSSEEEYRLAAVASSDNPLAIEFRARHGVIIPFIAVDFGEKLPISDVTIGPKNNIDIAKKGMDYYLKSKGYDLQKVRVSKSIAALRY